MCEESFWRQVYRLVPVDFKLHFLWGKLESDFSAVFVFATFYDL